MDCVNAHLLVKVEHQGNRSEDDHGHDQCDGDPWNPVARIEIELPTPRARVLSILGLPRHNNDLGIGDETLQVDVMQILVARRSNEQRFDVIVGSSKAEVGVWRDQRHVGSLRQLADCWLQCEATRHHKMLDDRQTVGRLASTRRVKHYELERASGIAHSKRLEQGLCETSVKKLDKKHDVLCMPSPSHSLARKFGRKHHSPLSETNKVRGENGPGGKKKGEKITESLEKERVVIVIVLDKTHPPRRTAI
jgi:hypothetical protein